MRSRLVQLLLLTISTTLFACNGDSEPAATSTQAPLAGGVVATFETPDGTFNAFITNESTIEELFRVRDGESSATIPNGSLLPGPGTADHNAPWSWHLDPEQTEMVELTIELCDGTAAFVEEELEYWLNEVGRYCPWDADLIEIVDHR